MFDIADYQYELPQSLIAQHPLPERDASRLLVLDRAQDRISHRLFRDMPLYLRRGDLLVVNDTKVFPARLMGRTAKDRPVEVLLLHFPGTRGSGGAVVECLIKKSRRTRVGGTIRFSEDLWGQILALPGGGRSNMEIFWEGDLEKILLAIGQTPLPPYIRRAGGPDPGDGERYQTIYARAVGSVAAPTAGLHLSPEVKGQVADRGIHITAVTLHVGYGTFAPVRVRDIRDHRMHAEYYEVSEEAACRINETKSRGNAVVAVGTTTARVLESAARADGRVRSGKGTTDIFIYPGYMFKVIDHLITNFHLPGSTLLMMVSALAGREKTLHAYQEAVKSQYRFFSYGDAMLIL